jgi:hypothetical protein
MVVGPYNMESKYPARLEICPSCGDHGYIQFRNGLRSVDCWTKKEFLEVIEGVRNYHVLSKEEVTDLTLEISKLDMPDDRLTITVIEPPDPEQLERELAERN